jgi:hypothetical protein
MAEAGLLRLKCRLSKLEEQRQRLYNKFRNCLAQQVLACPFTHPSTRRDLDNVSGLSNVPSTVWLRIR